MGIGIALGGVAQGLATGFERQQRGDLERQKLGIQERALKNQERNALLERTDKLLASEMDLAFKIIDASRGQPPTKIIESLSDLGILKDIERMAPVAGSDPSVFLNQISAYANVPVSADPVERKRVLEVAKLEREAALEKANFTDTIVSIDAGLNAFDTIERIPGAEFFLLNPGSVPKVRTALAAKEGGGLIGRLQRVLGVEKLPSALTGVSEDQLKTALDAAETVNKQRNALIQRGAANQAGVAGLLARNQSLGEGAGLSVQREVFKQARELTVKQLEAFDSGGRDVSTGPQPLPETEAELEKGKVYNLPDGRQALWNGKELELLN